MKPFISLNVLKEEKIVSAIEMTAWYRAITEYTKTKESLKIVCKRKIAVVCSLFLQNSFATLYLRRM